MKKMKAQIQAWQRIIRKIISKRWRVGEKKSNFEWTNKNERHHPWKYRKIVCGSWNTCLCDTWYRRSALLRWQPRHWNNKSIRLTTPWYSCCTARRTKKKLCLSKKETLIGFSIASFLCQLVFISCAFHLDSYSLCEVIFLKISNVEISVIYFPDSLFFSCSFDGECYQCAQRVKICRMFIGTFCRYYNLDVMNTAEISEPTLRVVDI